MTFKRITVDKSFATTLLNPSPVTLVTAEYEDKQNIVTVNWNTPVSFSPTVIAIMVGRRNHSHQMIESSRQFAINIPDQSLLREIKLCGSISGSSRDKFLESGLTTLPALAIHVPLISECFAHIECQLVQTVAVGDHSIFCGNVVSVFVQEGLFTAEGEWDLAVRRPVIHLGQEHYVTLSNRIQ
jgi:flavin reductase (DIM6/NTAB) family NADH-FMN oxidoreductase RutF